MDELGSKMVVSVDPKGRIMQKVQAEVLDEHGDPIREISARVQIGDVNDGFQGKEEATKIIKGQ